MNLKDIVDEKFGLLQDDYSQSFVVFGKEEAILKIIDYAIKGARFSGTYDDPVEAVHEVMTLCEIAEIIDSELEEGN